MIKIWHNEVHLTYKL